MIGRALALVIAFAPVFAHAADVVVLDASGDDEETRALAASLGELLARLDVQLADRGEGVARVKVELGEAESSVTIFNRGGVLAMFRRLPRSATPALTIEAVAHVVQSAVEELVEVDRHPPPVSKPLSPPPIVMLRGPPPVVAPKGGLGFELAPMVGARSFASNAPFVFGGGVSASLLFDGGGAWMPRVTLLGIYNGPFDASGSYVQVNIQSVSLRALGGVRWTSGRWGIDLGAGLGTDALLMSARSDTLGPDQVDRDHAEWSPIITALAGVRYSLTSSTDLFVAVTGDVDLLPRRFVVQSSTGAKDLLVETWRVRPAVLLGFSFDLVDPRSAR